MKNSSREIAKQDPFLKNQASQLKDEFKNKIDDKIQTAKINTPTIEEQIFDIDILTPIEDLCLDYYINVDDLHYELYYELNEQIKHAQYYSQTDSAENYQNSIHLLELRRDILKSLRGILTSRQLFALYHFTRFNHTKSMSNIVCIRKVLLDLYSYTDFKEDGIPNKDEFIRQVSHFHPQILNELIEILDKSEIIKYCLRDPDNSYCDKLSDQDFLTLEYSYEEDDKNNLI